MCVSVSTFLTCHVGQPARNVLLLHPPHEAVDEAVALQVLQVRLAQVARVVEGPDLQGEGGVEKSRVGKYGMFVRMF